MEKRPYFVIGDLLANAFIATVSVALTAWLLGGAWGMVPGMLLGMIIALPLSLIPVAPFFGAMEILTPCMLSGMLGGMWGGMWPLAGVTIFYWGVGTGCAVIVVIYTLNAVMSGPQTIRD
jgi:hypothetical protein